MAKQTPADEYATDQEVEAAIDALSDVDRVRLRRVAAFRARPLLGTGLGIGADDLLQDAMVRTALGERRWRKKKVTLVKHLIETMRSIANHARDELKDADTVTATCEDALGKLDGHDLRSQLPDGQVVAAMTQQFEQIEAAFEDDDEVGLVLRGLGVGQTGPEIQRDLGITETEYETIMTRLRRGIDRKAGWRP
jgi:DNA-directed RNA polymerase specialized sigma24 family protein